jgi:hypothetical protein
MASSMASLAVLGLLGQRGGRHAMPPACAAVSSFLVQKSRILLEGCPAGMFQPILPQPWRLLLRLAGYATKNALAETAVGMIQISSWKLNLIITLNLTCQVLTGS